MKILSKIKKIICALCYDFDEITKLINELEQKVNELYNIIKSNQENQKTQQQEQKQNKKIKVKLV